MELVPNAPTVLARASSLWAAYGALAIDVGIKALEYLRDHRDLKWQDALLPLALLLIPLFRVVKQESLSGPTQPPHPLARE